MWVAEVQSTWVDYQVELSVEALLAVAFEERWVPAVQAGTLPLAAGLVGALRGSQEVILEEAVLQNAAEGRAFAAKAWCWDVDLQGLSDNQAVARHVCHTTRQIGQSQSCHLNQLLQEEVEIHDDL